MAQLGSERLGTLPKATQCERLGLGLSSLVPFWDKMLMDLSLSFTLSVPWLGWPSLLPESPRDVQGKCRQGGSCDGPRGCREWASWHLQGAPPWSLLLALTGVWEQLTGEGGRQDGGQGGMSRQNRGAFRACQKPAEERSDLTRTHTKRAERARGKFAGDLAPEQARALCLPVTAARSTERGGFPHLVKGWHFLFAAPRAD